MDIAVPVLFFVIIGLVFLVLTWIASVQARRRREAFQSLATRLGFEYVEKDPGYADTFKAIGVLARGDDRYAYNIVRGIRRGHSIQAFDYHYETQSRDSDGKRQTHHHRFTCFALEQLVNFPELVIGPESLFSKIGQFFGYEDIDFESIEFSKRFVVRSKDRKFAYDVCHARMMEHLLKQPKIRLEFEGPHIVMPMPGCVKPDEIEKHLDELIAVRELLPGFLTEAARA